MMFMCVGFQMVEIGKFDIEIESDKGKEDSLSFIQHHNFSFNSQDNTGN